MAEGSGPNMPRLGAFDKWAKVARHRDEAERVVAVMIEARRQFSIMGPLGWTFAKCLAYN